MSVSGFVWRWASLPAGVLALWFSYSLNGAPYITNDGYQYLDAASNLASGHCLCTNVALFDEQVARGRFPVPFTHFAPGYPLLVAVVSRTGVRPETAGYILSALSFLAVLWLIQDIALALGARVWVAVAFSLIWITNATALFYASMLGTETLFTVLLLALVALIVRDAGSREVNGLLPFGIGIVAALSYWVRYPGLFLVAAAGVYLLTRAWRVPRARRGALAGLLSAAALVGAVQLRNLMYTGSWRGGFNSGGHGPKTVLVESVRAFSHLITGDRVPVRFDIRMAIFLLLALLALFQGIRAWIAPGLMRERRQSRAENPLGAWGWTIFVGFIYIGGVILAALTTIADDLPRYYFPVFPLLLAWAAVACSAFADGWKSLVVAMLVLSAIVLQGGNLFVPPARADWVLTRTMLSEEVSPGLSMLRWLGNHTSPDGAIVAVEGQAVHYVVERPVVAVIPAEFAKTPPDESGFHSEMRQFRSRYLLLFPGAPADRVPEQNSYSFLRSVAAGDMPAWLKLAARTRDAAVYECADCAN